MGCIKSNTPIKIKNIEKLEDDEINQRKVISTYISSSDCGSEISSLKNGDISKTGKISENDSKKIEEKE